VSKGAAAAQRPWSARAGGADCTDFRAFRFLRGSRITKNARMCAAAEAACSRWRRRSACCCPPYGPYAPPGSGKIAALLAAGERRDAAGVRYYCAEFTVRGAAFLRHNLAVCAARDDTLFTFNAVAPESRSWRALARPTPALCGDCLF